MIFKERMLSIDVFVNGRVYIDFYYKELNELYSLIELGLYFYLVDYRVEFFGQVLSGRVNEFVYYFNILSKFWFGILEGDKNKFVNFYNDIVIIYFDNFNVVSDEDINKLDVYIKDSYILMFKVMKMIKEYLEKNIFIKCIILDLLINGGGVIVVMKKVVGFLLSKDQQFYIYEKINKILDYLRFRVDINNDKKYDEKDNINEYK